ncbi:MAG TPA: PP0621 family protein [Ramlibacter sp.]|nr:PP0621 family protein [Ramlibacter sp.]
MKFLLLIAILAVAYLLWRHARVGRSGAAAPPSKPANRKDGPQDMVCCPVCSVHLPRADAITGADGRMYCSQEHRLTAGQ